MRHQFFCTAAFTAIALLTAGAGAQPAPQPQDCTGKPGVDWNRQVKACTALIEAAQGSPQDRAMAYKSRASAYFGLGDGGRAMADDDAAIQLDPNFAAAYRGRGDIYVNREDPDRALTEYDKALQLDGKLVGAYIGRSHAYDEKGDFDHALADANEAVRLDAKSAAAYEMRGAAYTYKGDIAHAVADYDEAVRVDPTEAGAVSNSKGFAYMAQGDLAHAVAAFSEAVRDDPREVIPYLNRGRANLFAGARSKAVEDFRQALALAPKYAYAALWLDIAEARSKLPSTLPQTSAGLDMTAWPAPVTRMLLGQMTPAALLAAADDPNAAKKTAHVCEANFFSGEWALRQGDKEDAVRQFRAAARDCPRPFVEASAAALELKALGAAP